MKKCKVLVSLCVVFVIDFYYLLHKWPKQMDEFQILETKPIKSILIWNSPHRLEMARTFGYGTEAFVKKRCHVTQCQIFRNRSALPFEMYDAVVMNMLELFMTNRPEDEGFQRQERQRFVFLSQESPPTINLNNSDYEGYFNWTMSYRSSADIHLLYGRVRPKATAPSSPGEIRRLVERMHQSKRNYSVNKKKLVVWMASHCDTDGCREDYVKELQKHIDVDVYGACGNFTCPRNEEHWVSDPFCYDLLAKQYKFYLSFENSVCRDYATEKFYQILARDLIPVVYGAARYAQLAPPHSFINALNYTPRQLARLLHRLAANDTLYSEYFWWKEHYEVESGPLQMIRHGFCDLCRKLHQDSTVTVHHDITEQWSWTRQCRNMSSWVINATSRAFF